VSYFTFDSKPLWHGWSGKRFEPLGGQAMQMQQIRYFLALCEEGSFTRAAKRSGVTQPSLTNAISALERELGGPLFQRKPFTALTALGYAIRPHLQRIAETADHVLKTAQAFARAPDPGRPPSMTSPQNDKPPMDVSCSPSGRCLIATDLSEPA
jgi:molybdenum-dependent DNA-binding transcriptional regulator ModE